MSPRRARRLPASLPRKPRGRVPRAGYVLPGSSGAGDNEIPALRLGPERIESAPDGDWVTRQVPGAAATKAYRCPGCDQEIPPGVAHLVAWPAYTPGLAERRHWHGPCWQRRLQRHPPRGRGNK